MKDIKDYFVTYEIARKLKDLGFNEPCLACYSYITDNDGKEKDFTFTLVKQGIVIDEILHEQSNIINTTNKHYSYPCPMWDQVINWLLKKYNIAVVQDFILVDKKHYVLSFINKQYENTYYTFISHSKKESLVEVILKTLDYLENDRKTNNS